MIRLPNRYRGKWTYALIGASVLFIFLSVYLLRIGIKGADLQIEPPVEMTPATPEIDKAEYDRRVRQLAHINESSDPQSGETDTGYGDNTGSGTQGDASLRLWPVSAAYPNVDAILPFHRIVAYYGNFYSTRMGVLGEYAPDVMLEKLETEVRRWEEADPSTPVMPAIDYIAVTAQLSPGRDGKYRLRMPDTEIRKAVELAERIDGIVILEVQPGLAELMEEIRALDTYLSMPNVHLAIDPEFVMIKRGVRPGTAVGTVDATDVNATAEYLASLVREHDLPPKVLVVHRYTRPMVTNAAEIVPLPEVQIVIDMDGWGTPAQKYASYRSYVAAEPVQFTGFKLFYKNDVRLPGSRLLTPSEILELTPQPSFIQYH